MQTDAIVQQPDNKPGALQMEIGAAKPIEREWRKEGIVRHAFKFLRLVSELLWLAACSLH